MEERIIEILDEFVETNIEIKPESMLVANLGLSSLDVVNIVVALEEEYDIEIPDHVIPAFATVHDIKDYLDAHV